MPERTDLNHRDFMMLGGLVAVTSSAATAAEKIIKSGRLTKLPDLSIFKRFDFNYPPIGIRFAFKKSDRVPRIVFF
jgi:hypothetical protein